MYKREEEKEEWWQLRRKVETFLALREGIIESDEDASELRSTMDREDVVYVYMYIESNLHVEY